MTNLIAFHNEMTPLMDEGRAADVVYLEFSEALDTVFVSIITVKLTKYEFDK